MRKLLFSVQSGTYERLRRTSGTEEPLDTFRFYLPLVLSLKPAEISKSYQEKFRPIVVGCRSLG